MENQKLISVNQTSGFTFVVSPVFKYFSCFRFVLSNYCIGKFEMPSVDQSETLAEEDQQDQEIQNVSNNNSSDTARLIDQSRASEESAASSLTSPVSKPSMESGPHPHIDAVPEGLPGETEEDDCQRRSLIAAEKGRIARGVSC